MLCKHFPGGIAHDATSYGSKHPQLQPGQEDHGATDKSGDHQTARDRNLRQRCVWGRLSSLHLTPSWLRLILVWLRTTCGLIQRLLKDFHASLAVQLFLFPSLTAVICHMHNLFVLLP